MFSIPGGWEIIIIVAIIIVLIGGNSAISKVQKVGKELMKMKKEVDDIKDNMKN